MEFIKNEVMHAWIAESKTEFNELINEKPNYFVKLIETSNDGKFYCEIADYYKSTNPKSGECKYFEFDKYQLGYFDNYFKPNQTVFLTFDKRKLYELIELLPVHNKQLVFVFEETKLRTRLYEN